MYQKLQKASVTVAQASSRLDDVNDEIRKEFGGFCEESHSFKAHAMQAGAWNAGDRAGAVGESLVTSLEVWQKIK